MARFIQTRRPDLPAAIYINTDLVIHVSDVPNVPGQAQVCFVSQDSFAIQMTASNFAALAKASEERA